MISWLKSIPGVVAASSLSLITYIARVLLDIRYVFPDMLDMTAEVFAAMWGFYILTVVPWIWALVNIAQDRKAPFRILMAVNIFQFLFNGLGSSLAACPSPCPTVWPVGEIIIWSNTITGLVAVLSLILLKRQRIKLAQMQ